MPALLTRISKLPKVETAKETADSASLLLETSHPTAATLYPLLFNSSADFLAFSSLISAITTEAPDSAKRDEIPKPIPAAPPVTIAVLPVRSNILETGTIQGEYNRIRFGIEARRAAARCRRVWPRGSEPSRSGIGPRRASAEAR